MTLRIDDITFETDMPKLPETAPVFRCEAPRFDDRAKGLSAIAQRLDLGDVRELESEFGRMLASKIGAVEYFVASGAVWAANAAHDMASEDEFLDWKDLREGKDADGQVVFALDDRSREHALDLASELIEMGGFDMAHATKPQVKLMQVAQANEEGKTIRQGAGEATVTFGYALEDLPVIGAGGKTLIDVMPVRGDLIPTGAVNVWRTPQSSEKVQIGGTEAALAAGLLEDPDLNIAAEKGAKITIQRVRFGLMAMPAAIHQSVLFPALEYEARVDQREKEEHYFIGRVAPVATAKAYERTGLISSHMRLGM